MGKGGDYRSRPGADDRDTDWMDDARCAGVHPDLWFPERGASTTEAKAVCALCPVRERCLDYALANHIQHGIWGGESERSRRAIRRARAKAAANG